jgi:hypothetical protein
LGHRCADAFVAGGVGAALLLPDVALLAADLEAVRAGGRIPSPESRLHTFTVLKYFLFDAQKGQQHDSGHCRTTRVAEGVK